MASASKIQKMADQIEAGMRSEVSQIYLLLKGDKLSDEQKKDLRKRLDQILSGLEGQLRAAGKPVDKKEANGTVG